MADGMAPRATRHLMRIKRHLLPPGAAPAAGSTTTAGSAFAEVVSALTNYFDGAHNVQPELTRSIWHPEVASLKGVGADGQLRVRQPASYLDMIASGAAGSSDDSVLAADKIVSLEFSSSRTCLAKVEVSDPLDAAGNATLYTDFISLVDIAGRGWTVVSKIYAGRPLGTPSYVEPSTCTHDQIAATLQHYFNGQRSGHGSSAIMSKVFHPDALLRGPVMECDVAQHPEVGVGGLRVLTASEFFTALDAPDFPMWEDKGLVSSTERLIWMYPHLRFACRIRQTLVV